MKTFTKTMLLTAMLSLFFSTCKKEAVNVNGKVTGHSDCKSFKSANNGDEIPDTLSCVDYSFIASENKLILKHINAAFNCCPGELSCKVSFTKDTIVIQEFEEMHACDCDCLFDVDIEVNGVNAKKYYLKFIEPYCGEQEKLFFEIDLQNQQEGTHCAFRNQYPWGMFLK
jgi:hypothetical protein